MEKAEIRKEAIITILEDQAIESLRGKNVSEEKIYQILKQQRAEIERNATSILRSSAKKVKTLLQSLQKQRKDRIEKISEEIIRLVPTEQLGITEQYKQNFISNHKLGEIVKNKKNTIKERLLRGEIPETIAQDKELNVCIEGILEIQQRKSTIKEQKRLAKQRLEEKKTLETQRRVEQKKQRKDRIEKISEGIIRLVPAEQLGITEQYKHNFIRNHKLGGIVKNKKNTIKERLSLGEIPETIAQDKELNVCIEGILEIQQRKSTIEEQKRLAKKRLEEKKLEIQSRVKQRKDRIEKISEEIIRLVPAEQLGITEQYKQKFISNHKLGEIVKNKKNTIKERLLRGEIPETIAQDKELNVCIEGILEIQQRKSTIKEQKRLAKQRLEEKKTLEPQRRVEQKKQRKDRIEKISEGIIRLVPAEQLGITEQNKRFFIYNHKLANSVRNKKQTIKERLLKGEIPETIAQDKELNVCLEGVLEIQKVELNKIERNAASLKKQYDKRKQKSLKDQESKTGKRKNRKETSKEIEKNSKLQDLRKRLEMIESANSQGTVQNDTYNPDDIIQNMQKILYELDNISKDKTRKSYYLDVKNELTEFFNNMNRIAKETNSIEDLRRLNKLMLTSEIMRYIKMTRGANLEYLIINSAMERKMTELRAKEIQKRNSEYPQEIRNVAKEIILGTADIEESKTLLKGREVQLKVYMRNELFREIVGKDIEKSIGLLSRIIGDESEAFDTIGQMCLDSHQYAEISTFSEQYILKAKQSEEIDENTKKSIRVSQELISRARKEGGYSEIGKIIRKVFTNIDNNSDEYGEKAFKSIQRKIKEYQLDISKIIVGKRANGEPISLEELQNERIKA